MQPTGRVITWQDFYDAFHEYHILEGLMELKKEEFCNLTQGRNTVDEYSQEYTHLTCYTGDEVSTDLKKQVRFCKGLNPRLRHELNLFHFQSFQALVNNAIKAEHGNAVFKETHKHSHDFGSSFGSGPQKHRMWISNNAFNRATYEPRPSFSAPHLPPPTVYPRNFGGPPNNVAPRPTFGTCFKCGQPGH